MREKLAPFVGHRCLFRATFVRFGTAYLFDGWRAHYMLVEDVYNEQDEYVAQHTWVSLRPWDYVYTPVRHGNTIQFEAEVEVYIKGRNGVREIDYGLCKPAHVRRIEVKKEA